MNKKSIVDATKAIHIWMKNQVDTNTCGRVPLGNSPMRARKIPAINMKDDA